MDIKQTTNFLIAIGFVEYNYSLTVIAERAGLNAWQCEKAGDYQGRGILAYMHYLNREDRPKFAQAVIDIANERGYL